MCSKMKTKGTMSNVFNKDLNDGYRLTIAQGLSGMQFFQQGFSDGEVGELPLYTRLKQAIDEADAIVIGAGAVFRAGCWWQPPSDYQISFLAHDHEQSSSHLCLLKFR